MKRVTGVRLLLVVSLVLNVGLVSQFLVDIRKTRLTPALAAATYRRGKDGGEHFVLDFTTPMAPELVASTPDPVHVIPAFVYDLVWESPRRCALIPAKPLTPGIGVSIRPNPDLRDAAGTRLSTAAIALNTPPVVCLEIGATHRLTANQTRLDFRFNGAVRPVDLKAATKATDKAGHALDITAPETEPLTSPSITVTHPSDCEVFTLTVGPGLRATGAEVGMAKPFTRKVGLSDGLLLGEVTAGSNNDGIYLRCSIPGPIAVEQLGRFISVSPDVGEVHFEPEYWGGRYRLRGAFKPRSYYKVTFRDGLHTTDGRRLRKEVTRSVVTGNRQSVLSFATRGPFFPSHRRPVLPIETCNVDEIRLTATRIFPNNALTFFRDGADTEGRNGVQVGSTIVPSSLAPNTLGTVDVPFADLFGNARTGIFRVSAIDDGSYWPRTERTVVLTNLALQATLAPNRVLVHVRRLDDNVAVAGAAVSVLNYRNQSLGQAVTDEAGQALVALDADQAASGGPFMVIAEQDDDLTFLQLQGGDEHNLAQFDLPNRPYPTMSYEAFLYTERGICRPGETIQVTALVRDDELAVPDGMPVLLRVRDPRGALLFTGLEALSPTGFGVFTVNIPPSARTGHYDASLHTPGAEDGSDALGSTTFRVGAYTPDRLEAELTIP